MSLLAADSLTLAYGPKVLFEAASFTLGPTDRVGLVGPNGTGKSSLLKILASQLEPDVGELRTRRGLRLGYLPQELVAAGEGGVLDWVLRSVPGRTDLERRLTEVQQALEAGGDEGAQLELAAALADLHARLDDFEARFGPHRAERILAGLGFSAEQLARPILELSGGWRMRAALGALLLQEPDLLLLDEPTNHLDLPTLAWFDTFLRRYPRALMLISHDRDFLNRQIDRVLALEVEGLRSYTGNYDDYRRQRSAELENLETRAERQAARRAELQAFIDRFGAKASKARQAQSRAKMLERMEVIEVRKERATLGFKFPEVVRSGKVVAELKGLSKRFGQNVVYEGIETLVERGQRIAVVGVNGAGKTTLLKLLAGELPADAGTVTLGHNVKLAYFAQHHADVLDANRTLLEELRASAPTHSDATLRSALGAFLFSGDAVDKRVGVLSGGERARVALAKLLLADANFLLLDEPTNHLDLDSSEALIEALRGFGGTLLFVSHNRSFLNQLATHVWEVRDRRVTPFPGNLDDYLHHLAQGAEAQDGSSGDTRPESTRQSAKDKRRAAAEERARRQQREGPIRAEIAKLEAQIGQLEAVQKEREQALCDPAVFSKPNEAKALTQAHHADKALLEKLYAQWEEGQGRLEACRAEGEEGAA